MHQLTGMDASFLYLETPTQPMHISGLSIYDQSTAPGGVVRFKEIVANISERVKPIPAMTRRLQAVPLSLDHPYWISDGNFDPEFHIRHIALPKPGDWRQLCILVSRLHARQLDRARPLWEIYIIEGLDNVEGAPPGSFAMFSKTHHAAIDGASGVEIMSAIHDLAPEYEPVGEPLPVPAEPVPSRMQLLMRAQLNNLKKPFHFVGVARNTVPGFASALNRLRKSELHRVKDVPRTRFNRQVSAHRVFEATQFPLADIKSIKNSIPGATVNDVALAIVGGALRKYLAYHDELPEHSLAAMAPINVRSDKDKSGGNVVSSMTVKVRSDIEGPLQRLAAVHESTRNAKELAKAVGAKTMAEYMEFLPSMLTAQAARLASQLGLTNRVQLYFNCVITNVPGPQFPLYSTGAKMLANYGTGPVMDGVALFHVIGSYNGNMTISATSCREIMPDPSFYRQCIDKSFAELQEAAAEVHVQSKPVRKKRARKASPKANAAQTGSQQTA
ncbi:MAG: wax ester/triacylglycerol synthase family O-acyltransferase [Gammaproteobacteria bacterium]|nr:wax ester/triacylglycerol synthase family O-acyltransferase [Gammaproteobacteria bacterium]MBT8151611.1 wax ester/triacylglycerol synthase family O-acyltransferase [Gammaproteobacteria bacterium]NND38643.1 wax ester/triacylglycerol synthase family O-acyltransferase [Pseudomonadales bacterium]NNM11721.1 wax ester/triacylglycerol synthase family O-acyltransferase [Pseudomonadales bacterium]RZV56206.1 MAG: wax ester/triacylglycerol synthase family O-acyltransferase [Pseudomonadales bacterium]